MSLEIVEHIEQAEQQAAQIVQQAEAEAQALAAQQGAALAARAQQTAGQTREDVRALLEDEGRKTQAEIDRLAAAAAQQREDQRAQGMQRVPQAASMIVDHLLKGM